MMHPRLLSILTNGRLTQQIDGIYSAPAPPQNSSVQDDERELRERVASHSYDNYLDTVARNHSMPVMDSEIDRFLAKMPEDSIILDIGGCWGWHWRRIAKTRPDIGVLIIDFIHTNLTHALNVLGSLVGTQVALVHADATALPFITESGGIFEGVWTVQTFQHIPDFTKAVEEAHRVLKPGGHFINYSLHITPLNRLIYKVLGKSYHVEGMVKKAFYLARANNNHQKIIEHTFKEKVTNSYSECFFHPDLHLTFSGRTGNSIGSFDAWLSNSPFIGRWIGRQRSFEAKKK